MAKELGLDLRGAYVNLDGGFDSRANRKCIFTVRQRGRRDQLLPVSAITDRSMLANYSV